MVHDEEAGLSLRLFSLLGYTQLAEAARQQRQMEGAAAEAARQEAGERGQQQRQEREWQEQQQRQEREWQQQRQEREWQQQQQGWAGPPPPTAPQQQPGQELGRPPAMPLEVQPPSQWEGVLSSLAGYSPTIAAGGQSGAPSFFTPRQHQQPLQQAPPPVSAAPEGPVTASPQLWGLPQPLAGAGSGGTAAVDLEWVDEEEEEERRRKEDEKRRQRPPTGEAEGVYQGGGQRGDAGWSRVTSWLVWWLVGVGGEARPAWSRQRWAALLGQLQAAAHPTGGDGLQRLVWPGPGL